MLLCDSLTDDMRYLENVDFLSALQSLLFHLNDFLTRFIQTGKGYLYYFWALKTFFLNHSQTVKKRINKTPYIMTWGFLLADYKQFRGEWGAFESEHYQVSPPFQSHSLLILLLWQWRYHIYFNHVIMHFMRCPVWQQTDSRVCTDLQNEAVFQVFTDICEREYFSMCSILKDRQLKSHFSTIVSFKQEKQTR